MTFCELYKTLVVVHKLVSHEYFMDDMHIADLYILTKYLDYAEISSWIQTRQLMLCSLKPYLKKKDMTAQELWPLPIDDDVKHTTEMTNKEVAWFKRFTEYWKKKKG